MTTSSALPTFTQLPGEEELAQLLPLLSQRGFGVELVDDLDAARAAVLSLLPEGSTVMTNTSVTLEQAGIAAAVKAGAYAAYGQPSFLGKVLEIRRDSPGGFTSSWSGRLWGSDPASDTPGRARARDRLRPTNNRRGVTR